MSLPSLSEDIANGDSFDRSICPAWLEAVRQIERDQTQVFRHHCGVCAVIFVLLFISPLKLSVKSATLPLLHLSHVSSQMPTLMKATADDETPCPGYLFQEIGSIL